MFKKKIYSYGIILIRYNKNKKRYEILMIKKTNTYSFNEFVFSNYDVSIDSFKKLLNNINFYEKRMILTFDFKKIWEFHWNTDITKLNSNSKYYKHYYEKKEKFDKIFSNNENKNTLKKIIYDSINTECLWEIPKGRRLQKSLTYEKPLDTAIREFKEETGIKVSNYLILYDSPPIIISYVDNKVKYINIFYIAKLENEKLKINTFSELSEVSQIKWISLIDIDNINIHDKIKIKFKRIMKLAIKKYKKYKY